MSPTSPGAGVDPRAGGLLRTVAAAFAAFALVAVTLSTALTYLSSRSTLLASQGERLAQFAAYSALSLSLSGSDPAEDVALWLDMPDVESPEITCEDHVRAFQEAFDAYSSCVEAFNAASDEAQDEMLDELYGLQEAYDRVNVADNYYFILVRVNSMKDSFDLAEAALLAPDPESQTAMVVAAGVSGDESAAAGDVPFLGDELERPRSEYPGLWEAFESGEASTALHRSPDGSLYSAYAVAGSVRAATWVVEVSIPAASVDAAVLAQMAPTLAVTGAVYVACLAVLLAFFRARLVRPLVRLSGIVAAYGEGHDLGCAGSIRAARWPADEVGLLADSTAEMIDETAAHVESIASLERDRERVRAELELAAHIQSSALPPLAPPFTGGSGFELAARMRPAKEVGGDFYDFFTVGEGRVGVVVADVSDKGVPAALFMMRAKATIRQLASEGADPAEVMARANDELCRDNDEGMFVTAWLGVLDARTGRLANANAGHNPPLVRPASGEPTWLRGRSGIMLGSFEGVGYRPLETSLAPGDELVLYTDGVTEAMDGTGACLGERRLLELVDGAGEAPGEVVDAVLGGVRAFSGDEPQSDDVTIVCLRREQGAAAADGVGRKP